MIASDNVSIVECDIFGNAAKGIDVIDASQSANASRGAKILNSRIHDNHVGVSSNSPETLVSGNTIFNNAIGVQTVYNSPTFSLLGSNEDWIRITDNRVFHNSSFGIYADGDVIIKDNLVYDHQEGATSTGVHAAFGAQVDRNMAYDNAIGVLVSVDSAATNNYIFQNDIGIFADQNTQITQNRIYDNETGIQTGRQLGATYFGGTIAHNVIYNNRSYGLDLYTAIEGTHVEHNTFSVGSDSTAIRVTQNSANVAPRNNIFDIRSGSAYWIDNNSQQGFGSDFNLFQLGESAVLGTFNNNDYDSLADWTSAVALDRHSLTADPGFVDHDGADLVFGFSTAAISAGQILDDQSANFSPAEEWKSLVGEGDDFVEGSGSATWTFAGPQSCRGDVEVEFRWLQHQSLSEAGSISLFGPGGSNFLSIDFSDNTREPKQSISIFLPNIDPVESCQITAEMSGSALIADAITYKYDGAETILARPSHHGPLLTNDNYNLNYHRNLESGSNNRDTWSTTPFQTNDVANYEIPGMEPDKWYELAATWDAQPYNSGETRFEVWSGDELIGIQKVDQRVRPSSFVVDLQDWESLGRFQAPSTSFTVKIIGNDQADIVADAILARPIHGNGGADDDLRLRTDSPGIDQGDLASYYSAEPFPNGGRANIGADGNSISATTSQPQQIQLLNPNGGEKLEVGEVVSIDWISQGVTAERAVLRMDVGGETHGDWLGEHYRLNNGVNHFVTVDDDEVDISGVQNPPPVAVYQSQRVSEQLLYHMPVPDGSYTVRLHFVEFDYESPGQRVFDVTLQNELVDDQVDVFELAGARNKAIFRDYQIEAIGGRGVALQLDNVIEFGAGAILSAIEISAENPLGVEDPRYTIDFSSDDGATWSPIADNLTVDHYGRGQFDWTVTESFITDLNSARLRVSSNVGLAPQDRSDRPFVVAGNGNAFYVNLGDDANLGDNQYTNAPGDDANSGKSKSQPMATLAALLEAYDLEPGDTVYVDTGTYHIPRNIVISADDAGVSIQGPTESGKVALFDRGNSSSGSYAFRLIGADDVSISYLSITGAETGIYFNLDSDSDSDRVTISHNHLYENSYAGIDLGYSGGGGNSNDDAKIEGNTVHGNGQVGIQ